MIIAQEGPPAVFTELSGGIIVDSEGTQHPWEITSVWSDAELEAIGVYRVPEAEVPKGRTVASSTVQRVNGTVQQVIVLGDVKVDLKAYAAQRRWEVETNGVVASGDVELRTDRLTQSQLSQCFTFAQNPVPIGGNPNPVISWKAPEGFLELTPDQVIDMYQQILYHIEQCFAAENQTWKDIDAGTITTAEQIDTTFAPMENSVIQVAGMSK